MLVLAESLPANSWVKDKLSAPMKLSLTESPLCGEVPIRAISVFNGGSEARDRYPAWSRMLGMPEKGKIIFRCRIGIEKGAESRGALFRLRVNEKNHWEEQYTGRGWKNIEIDLSEYNAKSAQLELTVEGLDGYHAYLADGAITVDGKDIYNLNDLLEGSGHYSYVRENEESRRRRLAVRPSAAALKWQKMEMIAFAHFGMNTFTGREWGDGTESPQLFNPVAFDADQWAKTLKEVGIKMIIITAKHHDGFCLWPSAYTEHSVKNSPWKNGRGDVVKEVADACRANGLAFGFYLSPWDRNCRLYGTGKPYDEYFMNQLTELLTQYGDVAEVWFDGACAEGPNGKKQLYDFPAYYNLVRKLQPDALMAICGPDIKWAGNESGVADVTNWSPCQIDGEWKWYPVECDVSIRPGWFFHENEVPHSPRKLVDIYFSSVGRNAVLLLNVPPDKRGLLAEKDVETLRMFRKELDRIFAVNLATAAVVASSSEKPEHTAQYILDGDESTAWQPAENIPAELKLNWKKPVRIGIVELAEQISQGQRVEKFKIFYLDKDAKEHLFAEGSTIGYKRLLRRKPVEAIQLRIVIEKALAAPFICHIKVY